MNYDDIEKIEAEALPKLTRALTLVKNNKKSGRKAYLVAMGSAMSKAYRLGATVTYQEYSKNSDLKVTKLKVNDKMIKRRAKLVTLNGFSRYRFNLLFLLFDIKYKKVQNGDIRKKALVDDWIARLPQILATECQYMMILGSSDTALATREK